MEILNDIGELLSKFPELAIWILIGVLFYKVFIIGSWIAVIKLIVDKAFTAWKIRETEPKKVSIASDLLLNSSDYEILLEALRKCKRHLEGQNTTFACKYLYSDHITFIRDAVREKVERQNAK